MCLISSSQHRSEVGIAQAALAKKSIHAPFSGKLGIRQIDVGEYITPGTSIVTLQSIDRLLLDFTLPESNFRDLAVGQAIEFKVRSYPDRQFIDFTTPDTSRAEQCGSTTD